ncbi:ribosome maturation factor RimP [Helicobacter cetorum]|uniref:Ribosome maturation factor RimP n=1 Tax=Helicobacter cetorum (strain ATCC BAA-429 / MIT 00-7128) TaxID=182217 RepID=I0EM14_HELC0|nr:ribosome maturation factor RimP [Helicobacter cetorum]AFI03983.1 Ribosome maturation factor rimP [Helicobacter cetorum MIT 00-7128]
MTKMVEEKIGGVIESLGYLLYDVSLVKENEQNILRVSLKNPNGAISLDICQEVSEIISPLLDVCDFLKDAYILEVSSMGLERVLKTPKHFKLSLGEKVEVKLINKESFQAIIKNANETSIDFELDDNTIKSVNYKDLKKVKTLFEW